MLVNDAIVLNEKDNVAIAIQNLQSDTQAKVLIANESVEISVKSDIPFGHKFAIKDIESSYHVIKYGEPIGRAIKKINVGEHVHVHNVESERGRGDWTREEGKHDI